jgi:hypothetical protein
VAEEVLVSVKTPVVKKRVWSEGEASSLHWFLWLLTLGVCPEKKFEEESR